MANNPLSDVKPDRSGPKNLAILLFLGALLVLVYGYADLQAHRVGLNEAQVDTLLATPNAQGGEPTTVEDYRAFEEEARSNNAFLIRAVSLLVSGGLLLVGAVLLHRLRRLGAYLCTAGALIGLFGGVGASFMVRSSARTHLQDAVVTTYEAWVYICGAMMGLCLAVAALPLLNLRANMALQPVRMVVNDESE
jgi:hypothetical protein